MTLGEYRIGIDFNPSGLPNVGAIKRAAADFIDLIVAVRESTYSTAERERLFALAMTHIEDAAMWAVKAATKKEFPNG